MTNPRVYKTEAIVLKRTKLGEADGILTLYTPYLGKFSVVAKGMYQVRSKLGGHVELLNHSMLMLARGRNLDIVTQAQAADSFLSLRGDLWRSSGALYIAELVDGFTAEHVENFPLFRLLLDTLHRLCQSEDCELILRYFELHLLDYLVYRPQLHQCLGCERQLEPVDSFFNPPSGGVLCPDCSPGEPAARPLSLNALKILRLLQDGDYALVSRVRMRPRLSVELRQTMRWYIGYLLEREVKSARWLDRLRREGIKACPVSGT